MRQRNIKNLEERLELNSACLIESPKECKGKWAEIFGNDNPIYLEIGCGKGKFIMSCAEAYPERNYIAVEGQSNVALRVLEKAAQAEQKNLRVFIDYINDLNDYFEKGELAGLFLNFSDPWPKARHAKRRLTYHKRLENYKGVIGKEGTIEFKTDNDGLFEFTLEEIKLAGYEIIEMTRDLHGKGNESGNDGENGGRSGNGSDGKPEFESARFTTEYEEKFSAAGKNINYVKF